MAVPPTRERRANRGPRHRGGSSRFPSDNNNKGRAGENNVDDNEKPRCKKDVVMTTDTTKHEVPHYSQYTQDEINSIWFTQQEIDETMNECQETVQCMQDGMPLADEDSEFTTRGLEYMTTSGFDITTSSLDGVKMILEEQEKLRKDGEQATTEMLANLVEGLSMHRLRIAHLAAMKDARGVYGEGNFKTTVPKGRAMRSRSLNSRRNNSPLNADGTRPGLTATNSGTSLRRASRRTRASLGQQQQQQQRPSLQQKPNRSTSDPSSDAIKAAARNLLTESSFDTEKPVVVKKNLSDCDDPAVQAALQQMRARRSSSKSSIHSQSSNTTATTTTTTSTTNEPGS